MGDSTKIGNVLPLFGQSPGIPGPPGPAGPAGPAGPTGTLLNFIARTTPGAGNLIIPADCTAIYAQWCAGGGAGGGAPVTGAGQAAAGAGGGQGGWLGVRMIVAPAQVIPYLLGAGGTGVAGAAGNPGGLSWFDSVAWTVNPGQGGRVGAIGLPAGSSPGGTPFGAFAGFYTRGGAPGTSGIAGIGTLGYGGTGGGEGGGVGGTGVANSVQSGAQGYSYGAGGGGSTSQNAAAATGGAGADGALLVWCYS